MWGGTKNTDLCMCLETSSGETCMDCGEEVHVVESNNSMWWMRKVMCRLFFLWLCSVSALLFDSKFTPRKENPLGQVSSGVS